MRLDEYLQYDAVGLATLVHSGDVTPQALLDCALAQAKKTNDRTNAIVRQWQPDLAGPEPGAPLGPFAGVPFLLKDGGQHVAGLPTSNGSRALVRHAQTAHSEVVQRWVDAGLVPFGKTNVPELMLKAATDSCLWGRASNPWDLTRTPGGSSGGAAAAVASGVVPMAGASDGGGSIRIPASHCGLFGLRPSRGRVSSGPGFGEVWSGASSEGVLGRSVRDAARALDVIHGPAPGDPFQIPLPVRRFEAALAVPTERLRIGFATASPIGTPVDPEAQAAVAHTARCLASLGHSVEEAAPDIDGHALAVSYLTMYMGHVNATVLRARLSGAVRADFEPMTRLLSTLGEALSSGRFVNALAQWNVYARALGRFHQRYDLYLTPTVAAPAPLHGAGDLPGWQIATLDLLDRTGLVGLLARRGWLDGVVQQIARDNLAFVPFTQLANLTGTPAMSVPLHWTPDGLPIGSQFIAPHGGEERLLRLAHQLETAQPWGYRLPDWVRG